MFKLRLLVLYYRVLGFLSWLRERGDRRHTSRAVRLQLYRVEFSGSNFCEGEITLMNMTDKQQVLVHLRPLDARNLPAVVKEGSVDWHVDNENIGPCPGRLSVGSHSTNAGRHSDCWPGSHQRNGRRREGSGNRLRHAGGSAGSTGTGAGTGALARSFPDNANALTVCGNAAN